jgi:hypothetical protein
VYTITWKWTSKWTCTFTKYVTFSWMYMSIHEHAHWHVIRSGPKQNVFVSIRNIWPKSECFLFRFRIIWTKSERSCFGIETSGLNLNISVAIQNIWTKSECFCLDIGTFGLNLMFLFQYQNILTKYECFCFNIKTFE